MGQRNGASITLEKAFASAFSTYFVGDDCFVKPVFPNVPQTPFFVSAQSVERLYKPQVCFLCISAVEEVSGSAAYMGDLRIVIDSILMERSDDYPSLETLHATRVSKVLLLLGNVPLMKQLMNAPAPGLPDNRSVVNFQLYGLANINGEQNKPEGNCLCTIIPIEVAYQPIGP